MTERTGMKLASAATMKEFDSEPSFIVLENFLDGYVLHWLGAGKVAAANTEAHVFISHVYPKRTETPADNGFPWLLRYLGFAAMPVDDSKTQGTTAMPKALPVHLYRRVGDRLAEVEARL